MIFFEPFGIEKLISTSLLCLLVLLLYFAKNALQWLVFDGAVSADVPKAGRHIQFDIGHSHPVLSAVVLLLHEQVHLFGGKGWAVFVYVKLEGFTEAEQRYAALVFDGVAHRANLKGKVRHPAGNIHNGFNAFGRLVVPMIS